MKKQIDLSPRNSGPLGECLKTVFPTIRFVKNRWSKSSKRAVRIYQGRLCVSVGGKLREIRPTGNSSCVCDLKDPALFDFGSTSEARKFAQAIAPVASFERLGLKNKQDAEQLSAAAPESIDHLVGQSERPRNHVIYIGDQK